MLSLLKLHVEEAVRAFSPLVDIAHHGIRSQYLATIDEQRDRRLLAETHTLADDRVELDRLKVVRD